MTVLIFRPSREPFAVAPRRQLAHWLGYFPVDPHGDFGRMDGIQSEALARLRVWPVGGPGVRWFDGTGALHVPAGDDRA